jgi:hypothetical protein
VGELFVLLIRICMPVHVICSVMQATNLSKVLMGTSNMGIIEVSAICLQLDLQRH